MDFNMQDDDDDDDDDDDGRESSAMQIWHREDNLQPSPYHSPHSLASSFVIIIITSCHRIVGYCAHWRESLADPDTKIIRPQQDYRGVWLRHYEDVDKRSAEGESLGPAGPGFETVFWMSRTSDSSPELPLVDSQVPTL